MTDVTGPVTTTIEDGVAVLRFDDGKANVLSFAAIESFSAALDRAEAEAQSVCIVGREGKLCAGFDLSVMSAGMDAAQELVAAGGRLLMRIYQHPQPVAVAVTGHALAAGALLVLSCDVRIGADVPAKIGLNETSIGMPLPLFAVALAEDRLVRSALVRPRWPPGSTPRRRRWPSATSTRSCPSTRSRAPPSPRRAASVPTARGPTPRPRRSCARTRSPGSASAAPPTWPASPSSRRPENVRG